MFQMLGTTKLLRVSLIFVVMLLFTALSPVAAFGPLGEVFRVNTYTNDEQDRPDLAINSSGNLVVVWESRNQDGSEAGIYGQRYNANMIAQGSEFRINTYTSDAQIYPAVAMDAEGDFVVTWQSNLQDGSSWGIYAQRYNAAGVAQGTEFRVNTTTTGTQDFPSIAMDLNGDFVIVWEGQGGANGYTAAFGQRFNADGIPQGSQFQINTTGSLTTNVTWVIADVVMDTGGDFIVTWQNGNETNGHDIYARRYNYLGVPQSGEFLVNTTTASNQFNPSITLDKYLNFVITWQSNLQDGNGWGIYAQRYNGSGVAQGTEFQINTYTASDDEFPSIAVDSNGNFIIVWSRVILGCPSDCGIYARRFNANGTAQSEEFLLFASNGYPAAIGRSSSGNLIFAARGDVPALDNAGVFAGRYGNIIPQTGPALGDEFRVNTYTTSTQTLSSIAMDDVGNFVITWQSNFQDGSNWGVYAQLYYANGSPRGGEFLVNTVTEWTQQSPSAAMDADGDFVIVWSGSATTEFLKAQRYNADGVPQGGEIIVSNPNALHPQVAMDDVGNFVVVWDKYSNSDIYARRFNANGIPQGAEFMVNTTTVNEQTYPRVAMDGVGNFTIVWSSVIAVNNSDIYAQRYNAAGSAQGAEFRVNDYILNDQIYAAVATNSAGNFVVTWHGVGNGDTFGQFAKLYNAAGNVLAAEFLVNTTTMNAQGIGWVAMDASGDFVISWESDATGDNDVYARQYNAAAVPQGDEFLVNVATDDYQGFFATVAMNNDGYFVVTYLSIANTNQDIYARRFGTPPTIILSASENEFFAVFEQERLAYPAIAQGIADFVVNGINMTVTLNTGEAGRVNFVVANENGIVTIQVASITTLTGAAAAQSYITVINRDLPLLLTAVLDNLALENFGAGHNVESLVIDASTMTLTVSED